MDRERERGYRLPFLDRIPRFSYDVEIADTGGAFRPDWRQQDPAVDSREPYGGESSSVGSDHGWSNCTMVAAALGYAYEAGKQSGPQGGDMRHNQDDLTGGTDLYDARVAWERYGGHTLTIRNGAGWAAVEQAHNEGRAIVIQGEGNVPGSEAFDGGHACIIGPETNVDGQWLFGDPLASGWQWCSSKQIREWAQALDYEIMFAVGSPAGEDDVTTTVTVHNPPGGGNVTSNGEVDIWTLNGIKETVALDHFPCDAVEYGISQSNNSAPKGAPFRRLAAKPWAGYYVASAIVTYEGPAEQPAEEYELVENLYIKKT